MAGTTKLMTPGGGGVSLTPASSIASDVTVNVPSQNCTLGIQGPAFSAYPSATQSISATTWTKVVLDAEEFDTNNNFASSRFTPTVAGYYSVSGNVGLTASSARTVASIYKNGSTFKQGPDIVYTSSLGAMATATAIYMNGSTDYLELYAWTGNAATISNGLSVTYFQAALVRAA